MKRALGMARSVLRNRGKGRNLPRFLTYIVTFTCNARCIMCDSWKKPSPDDLSIEEIEDIFRQMPRMDALRLTGGEPFVRQDMAEITRLAAEHLDPIFVHITTNGFLTDRIVKFCEEREKDRPLELLISMDGVEEKHNHVRGTEIAWKKTLETIKALAPRKDELRLNLAVNQTIVDPEGADHYRKLRDVLAPYGVRNNVVMAYDSSSTYTLGKEETIALDQIGQFTTFGDFSAEHLERLMDEIEEDLSSYPFRERLAKRYYVEGIRARLLGGQNTPNPKCVAMNSHMRLYPDGTVPVCQFNSKRVGSFREKSFEEIWFGNEAKRMRTWVQHCPGCWAECEVLPSAIYTGSILRQLNPFRRKPPRHATADAALPVRAQEPAADTPDESQASETSRAAAMEV